MRGYAHHNALFWPGEINNLTVEFLKKEHEQNCPYALLISIIFHKIIQVQ